MKKKKLLNTLLAIKSDHYNSEFHLDYQRRNSPLLKTEERLPKIKSSSINKNTSENINFKNYLSLSISSRNKTLKNYLFNTSRFETEHIYYPNIFQNNFHLRDSISPFRPKIPKKQNKIVSMKYLDLFKELSDCDYIILNKLIEEEDNYFKNEILGNIIDKKERQKVAVQLDLFKETQNNMMENLVRKTLNNNSNEPLLLIEKIPNDLIEDYSERIYKEFLNINDIKNKEKYKNGINSYNEKANASPKKNEELVIHNVFFEFVLKSIRKKIEIRNQYNKILSLKYIKALMDNELKKLKLTINRVKKQISNQNKQFSTIEGNKSNFSLNLNRYNNSMTKYLSPLTIRYNNHNIQLNNISNFKTLNINQFLNLGYSLKDNDYQKNLKKNKINAYNDNMYITGVQNDNPFWLNDTELNSNNNINTITSPMSLNLSNNQNKNYINNIKIVKNKFIESNKNKRININNNIYNFNYNNNNIGEKIIIPNTGIQTIESAKNSMEFNSNIIKQSSFDDNISLKNNSMDILKNENFYNNSNIKDNIIPIKSNGINNNTNIINDYNQKYINKGDKEKGINNNNSHINKQNNIQENYDNNDNNNNKGVINKINVNNKSNNYSNNNNKIDNNRDKLHDSNVKNNKFIKYLNNESNQNSQNNDETINKYIVNNKNNEFNEENNDNSNEKIDNLNDNNQDNLQGNIKDNRNNKEISNKATTTKIKSEDNKNNSVSKVNETNKKQDKNSVEKKNRNNSLKKITENSSKKDKKGKAKYSPKKENKNNKKNLNVINNDANYNNNNNEINEGNKVDNNSDNNNNINEKEKTNLNTNINTIDDKYNSKADENIEISNKKNVKFITPIEQYNNEQNHIVREDFRKKSNINKLTNESNLANSYKKSNKGINKFVKKSGFKNNKNDDDYRFEYNELEEINDPSGSALNNTQKNVSQSTKTSVEEYTLKDEDLDNLVNLINKERKKVIPEEESGDNYNSNFNAGNKKKRRTSITEEEITRSDLIERLKKNDLEIKEYLIKLLYSNLISKNNIKNKKRLRFVYRGENDIFKISGNLNFMKNFHKSSVDSDDDLLEEQDESEESEDSKINNISFSISRSKINFFEEKKKKELIYDNSHLFKKKEKNIGIKKEVTDILNGLYSGSKEEENENSLKNQESPEEITKRLERRFLKSTYSKKKKKKKKEKIDDKDQNLFEDEALDQELFNDRQKQYERDEFEALKIELKDRNLDWRINYFFDRVKEWRNAKDGDFVTQLDKYVEFDMKDFKMKRDKEVRIRDFILGLNDYRVTRKVQRKLFDTYIYKEPVLIGNGTHEKHSISWEENSDAELKKSFELKKKSLDSASKSKNNI